MGFKRKTNFREYLCTHIHIKLCSSKDAANMTDVGWCEKYFMHSSYNSQPHFAMDFLSSHGKTKSEWP